MEKHYKHISIYTDKIDKEIIYGVYPKIEIDLSIAKELVDSRLDFTNGLPHYVVIDFTNVKSVTKEARDYMNSPEGGLKGILGGAFLSNSVVSNVFVNLYLKINKPSVPAKFFTSREDALGWLKKIKNKK